MTKTRVMCCRLLREFREISTADWSEMYGYYIRLYDVLYNT